MIKTTTAGIARLLDLATERGHLDGDTRFALATALEALQADLASNQEQGQDRRFMGYTRIAADLADRI